MSNLSYIKNLRFFNKKGELLDLEYNEDLNLLTGKVYLPEVSVGLIENETIYVLEEFQTSSNEILYDIPSLGKRMRCYFQNKKFYRFFTVDNPYEETPYINTLNEIEKDLYYNRPNLTYDSSKNCGFINEKYSSNFSSKPIRFDIALRSREEGTIEDRLIVEIDGEIIAEIIFHCECIGEDDRFVNKLADFGEYIQENEEYIFRNSDIKEELPDYNLLNKKRKEFLIELHNIKPYFSSYKGIINILNLFDYSDLKLKEYWYDMANKKMFSEDINLYEEKQLENPLNYNPNYQKTTFFGLFYEFNKVVEEQYTEDGLPLVKDNFLFSNEEILIKLFGLKEWIHDREIGGVCTIIDIVGEWVFYNKYNINFWFDDVQVEGTVNGTEPKFSVDKNIAYIEDLRPLLKDWNACELPREENLLPSCLLGNFNKCHTGWFGNLKYGLDNPIGHDEPNIPVGAIINLKDTTFDISWDKLRTQWRNTTHENTTYNITWNNAGHFQFYEIEWIVRHENPKYKDFLINEIGSIEKYRNIQVILPYSGTYSVTLILHKYNNEQCKLTKHSIIEVRTKNADFLSYFRFIDKDLQKYETCNLKWGDVNSHFGNAVYDNRKYTVDEAKIKYMTSTLNEYRPIHLFKDDYMRYNSLKYESLENITWSQYSYHSWEDLIYNKMYLSKFIIKKFVKGGTIQINNDIFVIKDDINENEYEKLCRLIENWEKNPSQSFHDYKFTARRHKEGRRIFIECVSKFAQDKRDIIGCSDNISISGYISLRKWKELKGEENCWKNIPLTWGNARQMYDVRSRDFAFTMENSRIYSDYFDCPILTPIFFTIDNSEMVGKTKCTWTLVRESTGEIVVELNGMNYFCYTFIDPDQYSLSVLIEDTNGNQKLVSKNKIINIYDTNDFKALEYAK